MALRKPVLPFLGPALLPALVVVAVVLSSLPAPAGESDQPDRIIRIVAERFTFVPSQIKLKQGEVVELRIRSLDTNHGFRIAEAGVNVVVPKRGGGEARILFRAKKKGRFAFECSKACGAGHTIMRGSIVVR